MFNQNVNDSDFLNMFGGMLSRSMRVAGGDPDGNAVRQALPNFQSKYDLHKQRDIDLYGSEDAAIKHYGQLWAGPNASEEEMRRKVEQAWRTKADTDMRNYDLAQERAMKAQLNKPFWMQY